MDALRRDSTHGDRFIAFPPEWFGIRVETTLDGLCRIHLLVPGWDSDPPQSFSPLPMREQIITVSIIVENELGSSIQGM